MAFKTSAVFLLLIVCQMCLSARLPRNADKIGLTTTNKSSSSEESSEEFKVIAKDFEKLLQNDEKKEFRKIATKIEEAKSIDEALEGVMNFLEFTIRVTQNHTEPFIKEALNGTALATQININTI